MPKREKEKRDPLPVMRRTRERLQKLIASEAATPEATIEAALAYHRARLEFALRLR